MLWGVSDHDMEGTLQSYPLSWSSLTVHFSHAGICRHVLSMMTICLVGTGEQYAYAIFLLVHDNYAMPQVHFSGRCL